MNNLPLIVWDVDDVLNNLMASWIDDWSYRNKKKYRINDLIENPPNRMLKISLEEYYNDLDTFRNENNGDHIPVNKEIMVWFKEKGHLFHNIACTARSKSTRACQARWIYNNYGNWISTVNMSYSGRLKNKKDSLNKIEFLGFLNKDLLFIDDNEDTIKEAKDMGFDTLLYPQPWNSSTITVNELINKINQKILL